MALVVFKIMGGIDEYGKGLVEIRLRALGQNKVDFLAQVSRWIVNYD